MRWHSLIFPATGILAGALALSAGSPGNPVHERRPLTERLLAARLRAHFDSVDVELRERRTLELTPDRRLARVTLIGWLREYRDAGEFPRNDRFPTQAMPFFRDSRGVLCAMAYLIDRSGRGDIVDRVAATRNNAFITELADEPDLIAWLDSVGLSVTEAARIQPAYEPPADVIDDDPVSSDYAITSVLVSGASLATVGLNLFAPSRSTGWAGLIAGGGSVIAGALNLDGGDGTQKVAAANIIIGGGAMLAGAYRLLRERPARADSPTVLPTTDGTRVGLAMHATF